MKHAPSLPSCLNIICYDLEIRFKNIQVKQDSYFIPVFISGDRQEQIFRHWWPSNNCIISVRYPKMLCYILWSGQRRCSCQSKKTLNSKLFSEHLQNSLRHNYTSIINWQHRLCQHEVPNNYHSNSYMHVKCKVYSKHKRTNKNVKKQSQITGELSFHWCLSF